MTNDLIINNLNFANCVAFKFKKIFSSISFDEIQSAAYFGLVDAANKFKPEKSNCFQSFAYIRIVGAIRDYAREIRWGSRRNPVKILNIEFES